MKDVKKNGKPRTKGASPTQVEEMAKGLESLPPFSFAARGGAGGKVYIHSRKWRKGYEERKTANARRKKAL